MKPTARLIFFCGHAGTGKTTLAKRFVRSQTAKLDAGAWCFLDKDTLYGGYSSAVMGVLTGDPNDRDSPLYLKHLRDPEYAALLATARENLSLGINVVVVGPLSREVRAHQLTDHRWLGVETDVAVRVAWMLLDEAEARRRIERRGNLNDTWKLAHWADYRQRLFVPSAAEYPELIQFDNGAPSDAEVDAFFESLLQ